MRNPFRRTPGKHRPQTVLQTSVHSAESQVRYPTAVERDIVGEWAMLKASGLSYKQIAARYDTTYQAISAALRKRATV